VRTVHIISEKIKDRNQVTLPVFPQPTTWTDYLWILVKGQKWTRTYWTEKQECNILRM